MAIYRGTGGSGDSTTDATITEVTQQAVNAQNSADAAAASATAAATSATNAAASEAGVDADRVAAELAASNAATSESNAATSASSASTSATNASNSASAALASQTAAATSETNAATSESNAANSEINAANSETAASNSKLYAEEWATKAEDGLVSTAAGGDGVSDYSSLHHAAKASADASSASTSATTATTQAGVATTKATEASTSASNAATSESNAATSASSASTSATTATTQAGIATTKAAEASTSASNASTSATNASTSESNAATSASNAATSETNAATSASNAATSESNAASSASAAQTAQDAAEAAQYAIDGNYLGVQTSDPTLDLNGNDVTAGDWYFNSSTNVTRIYSGTAWENGAVSTSGFVSHGEDITGAIRFDAKATVGLTKGDIVYIDGVSGTQPTVAKANNATASTMPAFGVAGDTVLATEQVEIVTFGTLQGIQTDGINHSETWTVGDTLYVGTSGALTNVKPSGETALLQNIGMVQRVHSSNGSIKIGGAGRTAATPNLDNGNVFIGNASNYAEARALVVSDITSLQSNLDGKVDNSQVLTDVPSGAVFTDTVYTHPTTSGNKHIPSGGSSGQVLKWSVDGTAVWGTDNDTTYPTQTQTTWNAGTSTTESIISASKLAAAINVLAPAMSDADIKTAYENNANTNAFTDALLTKLNGIATSANNYVHPSYSGDDFSVDTGALSGATVVSDIDINVTTDASGHVTDANGVVSTRTLTLGDLGYSSSIPSGTVMLFAQTAAPTGWTKSTTHNNKALRVVSGTAGSGGSSPFTTAFGSPAVSGSVSINGDPSAGNLSVSMSGNVSVSNHTLSINQIPSHTHSMKTSNNTWRNYPYSPSLARLYQNNSYNTGAAGGNGAHSHGATHNLVGSMSGAPAKGNLAGSLSSATAGINVQYVDVIIATKN